MHDFRSIQQQLATLERRFDQLHDTTRATIDQQQGEMDRKAVDIKTLKMRLAAEIRLKVAAEMEALTSELEKQLQEADLLEKEARAAI